MLPVRRVLASLADRVTFEAAIDGHRVAVKLDSAGAKAARELQAMEAARAGGVPVPAVHFARAGDPAVLVLGWIDGEPLNDQPAARWRAAGGVVRRLHSLTPPDPLLRAGFDALIDDEARQAVEIGALTAAEASEVRRRWDRVQRDLGPRPAVFLHGDLQPDHVLCTSDGAVLIDWGDACTGDPLWDLTVLLLDHPHRRDEVLTGYGAEQTLRDEVETALDTYRLVRYVGEIVWLVRRGFDATASIEGARLQLRQ